MNVMFSHHSRHKGDTADSFQWKCTRFSYVGFYLVRSNRCERLPFHFGDVLTLTATRPCALSLFINSFAAEQSEAENTHASTKRAAQYHRIACVVQLFPRTQRHAEYITHVAGSGFIFVLSCSNSNKQGERSRTLRLTLAGVLIEPNEILMRFSIPFIIIV